MSEISDILLIIGRRELANAVGVRLTAVSNAAVAGQFPASWYKIVSELAAKHEIEISDDLFNWKRSVQIDSENSSRSEQCS